MTILLSGLLCAAAAFSQSFSIREALSAPFPTELTASPSGRKLAWVLNAEGVRNIWIAEAPDWRGRIATSFREDDGQEIGWLLWTPDEQSIVFVRGGSANRNGEIPNPLSSPAGAEQAVYIVAASGGVPRKIGEGNAPALSPKGDFLVYLKGGQVWTASLGGAAKPELLIRARGRSQDLRFSPDSAQLAFVSDRGDHSFVGVYSFAQKSVRYLEPSLDRDSEPVWSPDGRQVAFVRLPASRLMSIFGPKREGHPWSIRVANPATGAGREVWRASEGRGSVFRNVVAETQLFWMADDRVVFPWEGDGWTHLYSVPARGGDARLLTPSTFEVEYVSASRDARELLFNSNQDDVDRRHIWRVSTSDGRPLAVTRGQGIEWSPVALAGKTLAYLCSDARRPAHAVVANSEGAPRDLAPLPPGFPLGALVEPQAVTITAADGIRIPAQLFLPRIPAGEKRPAVIFFHGGSRRQMLLGWNYSSYYHNAYAMNQYMAALGYVTLSVNYRSGIGYGMEFREALNYGATGASEFQDVVGAGLWLRARADVDPKRIGLWGGSYGGYLTALGLARASDLFAAGVDIHGVHDWNVVRRNFVPSYDPQKDAENARVAYQSSPVAHVSTWRSPVLLIHGDDDRNVPFSESVTLVEALRDRNVPVEQLVFPDEVHSFLLHRHWVAALRATADFFERRMK